MRKLSAVERLLPRGLLLALAITLLGRALVPAAAYLSHGDSLAFHARDSPQYLELAESIAATGTYASEGRTELRRLPGFPLLLAAGVRLGQPIAATLTLHLILGLATVWLCFATAHRLGGERAGVGAALLLACAAGLWVWSSYLLSETLFVFLISAMLWAAVLYERSGRGAYLMLAIGLASTAAYVRIVGYPLPFVLVLFFAARARRDRARLVHAGVALALAAALLGAWHVRNGIATGYWGFSTQFERALYFLGGSTQESRRSGATYGDSYSRLEDRLRDRGGPPPDEASAISEMRARGLRSVLASPGSFAVDYGIGIGAVLTHSNAGYLMRLFDASPASREAATSGLFELVRGRWDRAADHLRRRGPGYWLFLVAETAYLLLCYALCLRALRRPGLPRAVAVILVPAICLLLLSGGQHANSRYRAPLLPSICVLAGIGLAGDRLRSGRGFRQVLPPAPCGRPER